MARARIIKPSFFMDEDVSNLGFATRLLFQGLWTLADKRGRLEDRPSFIRVQVFPYDNLEARGVSLNDMLEELAAPRASRPGGFIARYRVGDRAYIQIRNFEKHQHPHPKEPESEIPLYQEVEEKPRKAAESSGKKEMAETKTSVPSVPSVPSHNLEPTNGSGAKAPVTAVAVSPRRAPPTWLTAYGDAWRHRWGSESEPPWGEMASAFKRPLSELERDDFAARWVRFLEAAERPMWARPSRFVQELGQWAPGIPPPRKGKLSVGDQAMVEARKFLEGGDDRSE